MGKPGFGIFQARRKSSGNAIEDADPTVYLNPSPSTEQSGGFRVLNRADIEKAKQEQASKKAQEKTSKFGRFSNFGASGNKARTQSIDEDSPSSSKRDSKSSGSQSFVSRPYHADGSSSTLPSSAESDPNDSNMFANLPPRPHAAQHSSSPSNLSGGGMRKNLPPVPYPRLSDTPNRYYGGHDEQATSGVSAGRARALTTSSYASTAIAPKLDADLHFDDSDFGDMFSGLDKTSSNDSTKELPAQPGRSLLQGRRTFQSEPIMVDRKKEVEEPLKSWDSRGSGDHLISSPTEDRMSPPPPVPAHRYSQYAPVASHSPELTGSAFEDEDAKLVRQSVQSRKSLRESSLEQNLSNTSSSSPATNNTTFTSISISSNTTPKAAYHTATTPVREEDDDLFDLPPTKNNPVRKAASPVLKENIPPQPQRAPSHEPGRRVMTAAEFQAQQKLQMTQSTGDDSDDEYEDEDDAIRKREEEQKLIRQRQQMSIAREHMRRSTVPTEMKITNGVGPLSNGFPSETSLQADEWSDEDVPLGVLAQHGFPSRNKPPTQPANAMPSYFRSSSPSVPSVPERPASTGAVGNRASTYRPPFARNLPEDPYATMGGNGLVRQPIRESMGFNRAASVYNDPSAVPYDVQPQFTSLVDQIQMRDNAKQKYMGGASNKKTPGGPFTGALGGQMNAMDQNSATRRMSQMPQMGMPGMNPMMNMMGGPMPMMGMNQIPYPMYPQNELMMQQMYQQMLAMQAQNGMYGQPQQPHDPRMSMMSQANLGFQNPPFNNSSLLNVGAGAPSGRPMSIMSFGVGGAQPNPQSRPFSTLGHPGMGPTGGFQQPPMGGMSNGYTPSIAPSERSNIGLSARYRPVATGNGMQDSHSTVGSSMTLHASSGALEKKTVKGILKNKSTSQDTVKEDDEDDWGKMAARKSKFLGNTGPKKDLSSSSLQDLVRGVSEL